MKFAKAFLPLACILIFCGKAIGALVGADTAAATVKGWLLTDPVPLGDHLGSVVQSVDTYRDPSGIPLYHVVNLEPSGFVIVPADDQVEPIIAFVRQGHYNPAPNDPLGALVSKDVTDRVTRVRGKGFIPGTAESRAQSKWQELAAGGSNGGGVQPAGISNGSIDDLRVSPFIQTLWNQYTANNETNGPACYNYFTPPYGNGVSSNYVCGCVATALAQLMYYYQYPTAGVGTPSFEVTIDGVPVTLPLRGGNGSGGPYDWANMPLDPSGGATAAQYQAIGTLTYDAGVAVNMQYTAASSGAYMTAAQTALAAVFKFKNVIIADAPSLNVGYNLINMINPNLDASLPVLLAFDDPSDGHCAVVDGYGYSLGTLYHHLNMGWGGDDDVWYELPIIVTADNGTFYNIEDCVYNIYTNGTGEIISGRVVDVNTNPIAGATVTAYRIGGGTYTATTGANGIYALVNLPSSSSYNITATNTGYFSTTSSYKTTLSVMDGTNSGNVWGANFTLVTAAGPPVITNEPANQSIVVGQNATFAVVATGQLPLSYQWQVLPSGSPNWVNLADGAGYSGSATANLTVIGPPTADNGEPFQCVVTNELGSATSAPPAILYVSVAPYLAISTLAGTAGVTGSTDGANGSIQFNDPLGVAVDASTNVYVADLNNQVIRELSLSGTNWVSTTIAGQEGITGSSDGNGTNALFDGPHGIAVDGSGNVYVADTGNSTIRELTYSGGTWTVNTIAGLAGNTGSTNGVNSGTRFRFPMGLTVDGSGNLYVADEGNSQIRELSPSGGNWVGSTVAGSATDTGNIDGDGSIATFSEPSGITVDTAGNLYVADTKNDTIREIMPNSGGWTVTTIAGQANTSGSADGAGSAAQFNNPTGIATDKSGDLYVVDQDNDTIRHMTMSGTNWTVFTSAGLAGASGSTDGVGTAVRFHQPYAIAVDANTNVYISDSLNGTIRGTPLFSTITPAVVQLTKQKSGGPSLMLTWTAAVGQTYQVEYKTNFNQPAWNTLTSITATNWTGLTSIPLGPDPQRFYRVVQLH